MKYVVGLIALVFALVSCGALVSALDTGRAYWKPGFVKRDENPAIFWLSITVFSILTVGLLLMGVGVLLFR